MKNSRDDKDDLMIENRKYMPTFENSIKMMKKRIIELITAISAIFFLYIIFALMGINCPIKFLTGISCAGCGMTRAYIAVIHLDFKTALYYHPLFWMVPIACMLFLKKRRMNMRVYRIFIILFIMMFAIVYVARLLNPNDTIVVFEPSNSIVSRIINYLFN